MNLNPLRFPVKTFTHKIVRFRAVFALAAVAILFTLGAARHQRHLRELQHPFGAHFSVNDIQARATKLFAGLQSNNVAVGMPRVVGNVNTLRHRSNPQKTTSGGVLQWAIGCEAEGRHINLLFDDSTGLLNFWSSNFRFDKTQATNVTRAPVATPLEAARVAEHIMQSLQLLSPGSAYRLTSVPTAACHNTIWTVLWDIRGANQTHHNVRMMIDRTTGFPLMVATLPSV